MNRCRIDERGLFVRKLMPEDKQFGAVNLVLRGAELYAEGILQARFKSIEDARRMLPLVRTEDANNAR